MVKLISFAEELLLLIANEIHPADSLNFALVCRRFNAVSDIPLQRHRGFLQQYRNIGNHTDRTSEVYLPDVLKTLLDDPRIAVYIRRLSVKSLAETWGEQRNHHDFQLAPAYQPCDPQDMGRFIELARDITPHLYQPTKWQDRNSRYHGSVSYVMRRRRAERWLHNLKAGSESVIAVLLISRLTHLSTLDWEVNATEGVQIFVSMCERIVAAPQINPFSQLTTVSLNRGFNFPGVHVCTFQFFLDLPSMRTLHASGVYEYAYDEPNITARGSNVSALSLSLRDQKAEFLDRIIASPRALQEFAYLFPSDSDTTEFIHVRAIQQSLETHARGSLLKLTLQYPGLYNRELGNWSQFPFLRYLDLNLLNFTPHRIRRYGTYKVSAPAERTAWYQHKLPPLLDHLQLREKEKLYHLQRLQDLRGLIAFKSTIAPNLQRLDLHLRATVKVANEQLERDRLIEAGDRAGVDVLFTELES